jgi:transposase
MGDRRGGCILAGETNDGKCPMRSLRRPQPILGPFTCDATAIAVVELSQKTWLVGGSILGINRHLEKKIAPDEQALLHRWRGEAGKAGHTVSRIAVAFEAGRDGFWLARRLRARDIDTYAIYPTSIPVSGEDHRWISACSNVPSWAGSAASRAIAAWPRSRPSKRKMPSVRRASVRAWSATVRTSSTG